MASSPQEEEADNLLSALQAPDNLLRSRAEAQLEVFAANPVFLRTLMTRSLCAQAPNSRQLAGTLLAWRLPKLWPELAQEEQRGLQATLLECFGTCTEPPVLRALGEACNALSQTIAIRHNALWEELLQLLAGLLTGEPACRRKAALDVLASLVVSLGARLQPFYSQLGNTLPGCIRDPDTEVGIAALNLARTVADSWCAAGLDLQQWQGTADTTLEITAGAVAGTVRAHGPRVLTAALRALGTLAKALRSELVCRQAVDLACRVAGSGPGPRCTEPCCVQALMLLRTLARSMPELIGEQTFAHLVPVVCRASKDTSPSVDDLDDVSGPAVVARGCLRVMARTAPTHVLPLVVESAQAASQSPDAMDRAAAVHMISFALSGTHEAPSGWAAPLARGLGDNTPWVKQAACEGAQSLAEALQPSLATTEGLLTLLSALAACVGKEPVPEVAKKASEAIASIVKELSTDEAASTLQTLVPALLQAMSSMGNLAGQAWQRGDALPATVVAAHARALSAVAEATADHFEPYATTAASMLIPLLRSPPGGTLPNTMFAACLEAAGCVIASAWAEPGLRGARDEAAAVAQGILVDRGAESEVRASAHSFFAAVALASFEEFIPHLPHVVPPAVEALGGVDGSEVVVGASRRAVRTGAFEERTAAIDALGAYVSAVGAGFAPHLPVVISSLCRFSHHADPKIQAAVARTLSNIGRVLGDLGAGLPAGSADRSSAFAMAQAVVQAICALADWERKSSTSAFRCSLQAKEDLLECPSFCTLLGAAGVTVLAAAGPGVRSEDLVDSEPTEVDDEFDEEGD